MPEDITIFSEVKGKVVFITPALANRMMQKRMPNRRLSPTVVDRYKEIMEAGQWRMNGEPIIISKDDRVMDGQHRLSAIVETSLTIPIFVITGIEPGYMSTIDVGRKRNLSDNLAMMGVANYATVSSALQILWEWDNTGRPLTLSSRAARIGYGNLIEYLFKNKVSCETVHDELQRGMKHAYRLKGLVLPSVHVAGYAIVARADGDARADDFFSHIASGADLPEESPILRLRMRLHPLRGDRPNRREQFYTLLATWNAMNGSVINDQWLDKIILGSEEMPKIEIGPMAKKYAEETK